MEIEVTYFKQSGKYYMEESIKVPESIEKSLVSAQEKIKHGNEKMKSDGIKELDSLSYDFRNWFHVKAQHDDFIGVVQVDYRKDTKQAELFGYPMMILPKNVKKTDSPGS